MKRLLQVLLVLVILVVAGAAAVLLGLDDLLHGAVEDGGQHAFGTETRLDSVHAGVFDGELNLAGFAIANPPGFRDEAFLGFESASARWEPRSVLSDEVRIGEFVLAGTTLNLELQGTETNAGRLLAHLREQMPDAGEEPPPEEPTGPGKQVVIERIVIDGVKVRVHASGVPLAAGSAGFDLGRMELEEVRSDGDAKELAAQVLGVLVEAIVAEGAAQAKIELPEELALALEGDLSALEDTARERLEELEQDVLQGVEEKAKELGLDGVLGGDGEAPSEEDAREQAEKKVEEGKEKLKQFGGDLLKGKGDGGDGGGG